MGAHAPELRPAQPAGRYQLRMRILLDVGDVVLAGPPPGPDYRDARLALHLLHADSPAGHGYAGCRYDGGRSSRAPVAACGAGVHVSPACVAVPRRPSAPINVISAGAWNTAWGPSQPKRHRPRRSEAYALRKGSVAQASSLYGDSIPVSAMVRVRNGEFSVKPLLRRRPPAASHPRPWIARQVMTLSRRRAPRLDVFQLSGRSGGTGPTPTLPVPPVGSRRSAPMAGCEPLGLGNALICRPARWERTRTEGRRGHRAVKFTVIGAGGVGGYFGARLAAAGHEVGFVARGRHLEAMRVNGLAVRSQLGDVELRPIRASDEPAALGTADCILFTVKSYDCEAAAEALRPALGADTFVVPLLNGIGHVELLRRMLGPDSRPRGASRTSAPSSRRPASSAISTGCRSSESARWTTPRARASSPCGKRARRPESSARCRTTSSASSGRRW